jgi:hypothetical protein
MLRWQRAVKAVIWRYEVKADNAATKLGDFDILPFLAKHHAAIASLLHVDRGLERRLWYDNH